MRKMKKMLSLCLAVLMLAGLMPQFSVFAGSEVVYYENDFESGAALNQNITTSYGTYKPNTDAKWVKYVNLNGNMGMGATDEAYSPDYTFVLNTPIDSGLLSISYDIARFDDGNNPRQQSLMVNKRANADVSITEVTSQQEILVFRQDGGVRGPNANFTWEGASATTVATQFNTVYGLNAVLDLDNDIIYTYLNGKLLNSQNLPQNYSVYDVGFNMTPTIDYIDNFKIASMTEDSFKALKAEGYAGDKYINVYFTEEPKAELNADSVVITNSQNTAVSVKGISRIANRGVKIELNDALAYDTYSIAFTEDFVNVMDVSASGTASFRAYPVVVYENNFDGTDALNVSKENSYGTYSPNVTSNQIQYVTFKGNKGAGSTTSTYAPNYNFILKDPVSSGVVSVSFDIARFADSSNSQAASLKVNNSVSGASEKGIILLRKDNFLRGPDATLSWTGYTNTQITTQIKKVYSVNAIFDLNKDIVYAYCDGALLSSQSLGADFTLYSAGIGLSAIANYIDNFKISFMNTESFEITDATAYENTNFINAYFTEEPSANLNANSVVVTDSFGDEISVKSVSRIAGRGVKIELNQLIKEGSYNVSFKNNFTNVRGVSAKGNKNINVSSTVYYENSFDNGVKSFYEHSDDKGAFDYNIEKITNMLNSSFGGNVGIAAKSGSWGEKFSYVFDTPLTSGILNISYDISRLNFEPENASMSGSGVKLTGVYNGNETSELYVSTFANANIYGAKDNFAQWGDSGNGTGANEKNTLYTINSIIDLDSDKVYTYIYNNSTLLKSTERNIDKISQINSVDISLSGYAAYFDNLKISKITKGSFMPVSAEIGEDFTYADVTFTERPKAIETSDVTVKNSSGSEIAVSSVEFVGNKARLNFGSAISEGDYTISFGDGVVNLIGNGLANYDIDLEAYTNKVIVSGRLVYTIVKNETEEALTPALIIGAYDGDNWTLKNAAIIENVSASKAIVESIGVGEKGKLRFAMDSTYTDQIRAFLWKDLQSVIPMFAKAEITY